MVRRSTNGLRHPPATAEGAGLAWSPLAWRASKPDRGTTRAKAARYPAEFRRVHHMQPEGVRIMLLGGLRLSGKVVARRTDLETNAAQALRRVIADRQSSQPS